MENNPLSPKQVIAVTHAEYIISILYTGAEEKFGEIIRLIDENNIAEHMDILEYLHSLLVTNGYLDLAEEFAKKYSITPEEPDPHKLSVPDDGPDIIAN
jgi:hypothetical protein